MDRWTGRNLSYSLERRASFLNSSRPRVVRWKRRIKRRRHSYIWTETYGSVDRQKLIIFFGGGGLVDQVVQAMRCQVEASNQEKTSFIYLYRNVWIGGQAEIYHILWSDALPFSTRPGHALSGGSVESREDVIHIFGPKRMDRWTGR